MSRNKPAEISISANQSIHVSRLLSSKLLETINLKNNPDYLNQYHVYFEKYIKFNYWFAIAKNRILTINPHKKEMVLIDINKTPAEVISDKERCIKTLIAFIPELARHDFDNLNDRKNPSLYEKLLRQDVLVRGQSSLLHLQQLTAVSVKNKPKPVEQSHANSVSSDGEATLPKVIAQSVKSIQFVKSYQHEITYAESFDRIYIASKLGEKEYKESYELKQILPLLEKTYDEAIPWYKKIFRNELNPRSFWDRAWDFLLRKPAPVITDKNRITYLLEQAGKNPQGNIATAFRVMLDQAVDINLRQRKEAKKARRLRAEIKSNARANEAAKAAADAKRIRHAEVNSVIAWDNEQRRYRAFDSSYERLIFEENRARQPVLNDEVAERRLLEAKATVEAAAVASKKLDSPQPDTSQASNLAATPQSRSRSDSEVSIDDGSFAFFKRGSFSRGPAESSAALRPRSGSQIFGIDVPLSGSFSFSSIGSAQPARDDHKLFSDRFKNAVAKPLYKIIVEELVSLLDKHFYSCVLSVANEMNASILSGTKVFFIIDDESSFLKEIDAKATEMATETSYLYLYPSSVINESKKIGILAQLSADFNVLKKIGEQLTEILNIPSSTENIIIQSYSDVAFKLSNLIFNFDQLESNSIISSEFKKMMNTLSEKIETVYLDWKTNGVNKFRDEREKHAVKY